MTAWLKGSPRGGALLVLHVQPGAKTSALAGGHGDALKLRISARAVEGAANAAVLDFLAERLAISRREVTIAHGERSRRKVIWVGLDPDEIRRRLTEDEA
jgi:uncharacterized protein